VGTSHKELERLVLRDIAFSQLAVKGLRTYTSYFVVSDLVDDNRDSLFPVTLSLLVREGLQSTETIGRIPLFQLRQRLNKEPLSATVFAAALNLDYVGVSAVRTGASLRSLRRFGFAHGISTECPWTVRA
jgi:hypothetical protein